MSTVACGRCGAIAGAGAAFCSNCGARLVPPTAASTAGAPSVATLTPPLVTARPADRATAHPWERGSTGRLAIWLFVGAVLFVAIAAAGAIVWAAGQEPTPCSDPTCGTPPIAAPLEAPDPFQSESFGYALDASGGCSPTRLTISERSSDGVRWTLHFPELAVTDWPIEVRGVPAANLSANQLVDQVVAARYAGAAYAYSIPMAEIGFQPGYGAVYDLYVGAGSATPIHARAIVMTAVKGDLAIILDSLGPWYGKQSGHPNPAQTKSPICFSSILTSVTWPGEAPP